MDAEVGLTKLLCAGWKLDTATTRRRPESTKDDFVEMDMLVGWGLFVAAGHQHEARRVTANSPAAGRRRGAE